jgi:putative cofactor-binding repeat protein
MRARTSTLVCSALALVACRSSSPTTRTAAPPHTPAPIVHTGPVIPPPAGAISVAAYHARGDGVADDRAAIQAAIDAAAASGGDVYFPPGTYLIARPDGGYGLEVPARVRLHGAGQGQTVLIQAPNAVPSSRLIRVSGDDVLIEDLTLDGNKALQSHDKQRHGIFVMNSDRLVVRDVTARNFTGDGFYLYNGAKHALFLHVTATDNHRNGLTLGAMVDGTTLLSSKFVRNGAEQVDSEPGGPAVVSNTTIADCLLDGGGVSNDYALTVSGTPTQNGHGWNVVGNTINGAIAIVWAEHVMIAGNVGVNPTIRSSVFVYRRSNDIAIMGNRIEQTQTQVRSLAGVMLGGTGTGSAPARILIAGNDIKLGYEQSFGVRADGAISVQIVGNTFRGAGRPADPYAGIYLRATNEAEDFKSAVISGNTIRDFGGRGVSIHGNGAAKILSVDIEDNTFEDDSSVPSMKTAISLDDGTGAARQVSIKRNQYRGVAAKLINVPAQAMVTVDGVNPNPPAP